MNRSLESFLKNRDIAPTPVRILVYRCLMESPRPLSLSEIEQTLESVDKSTISRTLATFKKKNLVHSFNDGSSSVKYELSRSEDSTVDDQHIHFRCEYCGATICLEELKIPDVKLPIGFLGREANFVISGLCPKCNDKRGEV